MTPTVLEAYETSHTKVILKKNSSVYTSFNIDLECWPCHCETGSTELGSARCHHLVTDKANILLLSIHYQEKFITHKVPVIMCMLGMSIAVKIPLQRIAGNNKIMAYLTSLNATLLILMVQCSTQHYRKWVNTVHI